MALPSLSDIPSLGDIEIRHLLALKAVAQERSFGRAADRLGFTQSAVSQQIAALERLVGEPLFHRPGGPKPVEVTSAGRLMLEHAVAILDRLELAHDDLAGFRRGTSGRLVVGTFQSVSVKVLPAIVGRLRAEQPDLDVRPFESDDDAHLLSMLLDGDLDVTFCVAPFHRERIRYVELSTDPFVVVSTPEFEPAKTKVPVTSLVAAPMVGGYPNDACQNRIEAGLRGVGLEPRYSFRSGDNAAIQAMVRAGTGHAVMPLLGVDTTDRSVLVREISPPIPPRIIAIAVVADRPIPKAAEHFIEVARLACASVQESHLAALVS